MFMLSQSQILNGQTFYRDKLRTIFPLSAFHMNGYGQTEVSVMSAGPQELEGLGEIYPGVQLKVILVHGIRIYVIISGSKVKSGGPNLLFLGR